MLSMPTAARVTENCIRETGDLFPAEDHPIDGEDTLVSLNISKNELDLFKRNIAGHKKFGLASLVPKWEINLKLFDNISETSTFFQVFNIVRKNAKPSSGRL